MKCYVPWSLLFFAVTCSIGLAQTNKSNTAIKVEDDSFDFIKRAGELEVFLDGQSFATYVWSDPKTTRPYFKQIKALGGKVQLTRNHPPQEGDFQDHETYHPGIWWGFGDVGGNDYWRMKAKIIGGQFVEEPTSTKDRASFAVRNKLLTNEGDATFCEQICRYEILRRPHGILMICESEFMRRESDFWLGDQEEMGLAFRVATPLTSEKAGTIRDSEGRTDLKQIRTNQSDWCNYSGPIAGKYGGLMLMNDPKNFRKPWWHAVDTGLLIANPLGESELNGNGKKRENVLVKKGEPFRLRYGCLIHLHENEKRFDPKKAYSDFLKILPDVNQRQTAATALRPALREELPKVPDGFHISIFGNEPMIYKPTAACFDAQGRLMVGQGPQYPKNFPDSRRDSVVIVTDSDNDGVADTSKTFATGFNSVQGLAWKGNDLYVANAPELTVVRDLDGDDEADEYVVVFTDLGNREHALHGLNFAPDGKLYMSKGNSKGHNQPDEYGYVAPKPFRDLWGVVHPEGAPDSYPPKTYTKHNYKKTYHHWDDDWGREGGVLRCDPMGGNLEIVSRGLRNPWDMTMDDGFNFLGTDNDQDQGDRIIMPFFGAHFGWGHNYSSHWTGDNHLPTAPISGPVFPGSGAGIIYYAHDHFPPEYRNVFFINDWMHGTFIYRPTWDGPLMQPEGGRWETFASRGEGDMLYRPTDMEFGPDGSIYICGWGGDYHYDREKEGSWIFRVTSSGQSTPTRGEWWPAKRDKPLMQWTTDELIEDLGADSLPIWRVNAQDELVRRFLERPELMDDLFQTGTLDVSTQTWAIWAIARGLRDDQSASQLFAAIVRQNKVARDNELNLRVQALRIIGGRPRLPNVEIALITALSDPEPRIRFEAVQAIWRSKRSGAATSLVERLAVEQDRLVFYVGWQALRGMLSMEARKQLLKDSRSQVRLASLLSLQEGHEISLDEVLELAENDTDEIIQNWAMTWAMNPQPPKKMPNSQSRIEQEESVSMRELIKRADEAKNDKLRQLYLSMISRATYDNGKDDWEEVRDFYQTLRNDDERSLVMKPLARENHAQPHLWDAMAGNLELQQAAVRGWVGLSKKFDNTPQAIADILLSKIAGEPIDARVKSAIEVLSRLNLPNDWQPAADWDTAVSKAFQATNVEEEQRRLLVLLLRIDEDVLPSGLKAKSEVAKLSKESRPRLYSLLTMLNPRMGIDIKIQVPEKATIDGALSMLNQADAFRGEELFLGTTASTNCVTCHRINGRGNSFAPDLSGIGLRAEAKTIVQSILDPSATITEGYQLQTFALDDGSTLSGAVLQETGVQIRIVKMDGVAETIDVASVESRSKASVSAMPTGFELLGNEQVADIAAYLLTCRHGVKTAQIAHE